MSETGTMIGYPEAGRRLGVAVRVLRQAIRAGRLAAPEGRTATAGLSAAWVEQARAAIRAQPGVLSRAADQKVPPFARYEGTSAWRKYPNRVRAFNAARAAAARIEAGRQSLG